MPKLKFLVIEDDLFYQTYVNDLLAETGVDVLNAMDGEAGLAMAIAEQPDLIISDIEIPKIQGFVLFKTLRERSETKDIPVIMMSGKVEKALLERHSSLSVHAEGYLPKPFSGQVLIDMIRNVVGENFGFKEVEIEAAEEEGSLEEKPPSQVKVPPVEDVPVDKPQTSEPNEFPEISQFPVEDPETRTAEVDLTVLVVDDSRYICDIATDFLKELGIKAVTAADGESGYKVASDILPDLILLDVQMPKLNGFVVCEMLRKQEETKNIPIILMSAVVDDESFQRHSKLRYHADAYLQKPFMKSELHDIVLSLSSLEDRASDDIDRKTGFFVPPEDVDGSEEIAVATAGTTDPKLAEEINELRSELEGKFVRESNLEVELEGVKKEKDQLEAEIFELKKTVKGKESGLQDKLTLVTQRFEETRAESERLAEENRKLLADLEEASSNEAQRESVEELERKMEVVQQELNARVRENQILNDKLKETESTVELKAQLTEITAKLEQVDAVGLEMKKHNKLLKDEIDDLREREKSHAAPDEGVDGHEEIREKLQKEIEGLKRDLKAAVEAKKEVEDQAKTLLENRENAEDIDLIKKELEESKDENQELVARISEVDSKVKRLDEVRAHLEKAITESDELRKKLDALPDDPTAKLSTLKDKLAAAYKKSDSLEKERIKLSSLLEELGEMRHRNKELEKLTEELNKDREKSRKAVVNETKARRDLENRLQTQTDENEMLLGQLEEAKRQLDEHEEVDDKVADLESKLDIEKKLRIDADLEIEALETRFEETAAADEKIRQLENDNKELKGALRGTRKLCEQLEKEKGQKKTPQVDEGTSVESDAPHLDERLDKLEDALAKTVYEAQSILKEQKDKESALEESVESLMRSLEEERSAYRKDKEAWDTKELELRDAFEDALRESRRVMGEEAARLYPIHLPGRSKTLEVATRASKYGIAAAAAVAVLVIFGGGYFAKSRIGTNSSQAVLPVREMAVAPVPQAPVGKPPKPWVVRSGPEDTYEEHWRRNTVQSVSEDMLVQATLHTREELESAIKYTANKEGWTSERAKKSMADMVKVYDLSGFYYITVYSKNLKSGYPGYADNFERHIALRDHSGQEVRAHLPGELEGSKFISSRVSAAGKEMNPVFLYEVGLTVAFARKALSDTPGGLQLVLYDIGAVPMRTLTWDTSGMGTLSN